MTEASVESSPAGATSLSKSVSKSISKSVSESLSKWLSIPLPPYVDPADPTGATPRWVTSPGVLDGPLISQFLYRDVPLGNQNLSAKIRAYGPTSEFQVVVPASADADRGSCA